MAELCEIDCLILKSSPWKETSLIVTAFSGTHGLVRFVARSVRTINAKNFPVIGFMREINLSATRPSRGKDLYTLKSARLINSFEKLALDSRGLNACSSLASFILKNCTSDIASPALYSICLHFLDNFTDKSLPPQSGPCQILLTFLLENGLLPEQELTPAQRRILDALLSLDKDKILNLKLTPDHWAQLLQWLSTVANYADINLTSSPYLKSC